MGRLLAAAPRKHAVLDRAVGELLERARRQLLLARPRPVPRKLVDDASELCGDEHAEILVRCVLGNFDWGENLHGITRLMNVFRLHAPIARSVSEPALPNREHARDGSPPNRSPRTRVRRHARDHRSRPRTGIPPRVAAPPAHSSCAALAMRDLRSFSPAAARGACPRKAGGRTPTPRAETPSPTALLPARRCP